MYISSPLFKTFFIIVLLFIMPAFASAASLYLSPEADSYTTGKTFSARIRVSSPQAINAVSGTLNFPTDKLQVTSVSKAGSILTLWVQDPTYSNGAGTVNFEGVVPNPGYSGTGGLVAVVNFRVVGAGTAIVNFSSNSQVLANDGSGTNLCQSCGSSATYSLGGVSPIQEEAVPASNPGTPRAPVITSSSHSVSSKWYRDRQINFSWTSESGVMATRILFGKNSNSVPTVEYDPSVDSKEINDVEDGIWYFHAQNKNAKGWGATAHYMVKIDGTDPEVFTMKEIARTDETEPRVRLAFSANDNFSGIKSFGLQIDKGEMQDWVDDGTGIYVTDPLLPGEHTIFARAYDEAGNFATASLNVAVVGLEPPKITSYTDKVSQGTPLIIRGTAPENASVRVVLTKSAGFRGFFGKNSNEAEPLHKDTKVDSDGNFSATLDVGDLTSGAYDLTAITIDKRGAQSEPTAPKTVLVNTGWLSAIFSGLIKFLAVAVPVLGLIFLLYVVFVRGMHHVRMSNKKFGSELHNIERLVDRAFVMLKEDVEDSIRLLERTKSKRKLTAEEDAIIERLRQNLREAERVIHGEVRKIEREIE